MFALLVCLASPMHFLQASPKMLWGGQELMDQAKFFLRGGVVLGQKETVYEA